MNNKRKILVVVLTAIITVVLAVVAVVLIGGSKTNAKENMERAKLNLMKKK